MFIKKRLDEAALEAYASMLAEQVVSPLCIALYGEVGSGKTTFCRAFIRSLMKCHDLFVPSPTFSLVQVYDTPKGALWHCDFYRLASRHAILETGVQDTWDDSICLIEWPEKIDEILPSKCLRLFFDIEGNGEKRSIMQKGLSTTLLQE